VDELDVGFGWQETSRIHRTSHALAVGGRVWVIDPVEGNGVEGRIRSLGEPAGVLQLLDRHERACAAFAEQLGVPLHVVPVSLPGSEFEFRPVLRNRLWAEVALWWPERRILVCADVLGTLPYFRAGGEAVGLHPFLRLWPPRSLHGLRPEHVLVGHGKGLHGPDVGEAVEEALRTGRRRLPRWVVGLPAMVRRR
jgi:hypothetical protein